MNQNDLECANNSYATEYKCPLCDSPIKLSLVDLYGRGQLGSYAIVCIDPEGHLKTTTYECSNCDYETNDEAEIQKDLNTLKILQTSIIEYIERRNGFADGDKYIEENGSIGSRVIEDKIKDGSIESVMSSTGTMWLKTVKKEISKHTVEISIKVDDMSLGGYLTHDVETTDKELQKLVHGLQDYIEYTL